MATQKETVYGFLEKLKKKPPVTKTVALELFLKVVPTYRKEVFNHYSKLAIAEGKWEPADDVINIDVPVLVDKQFEIVHIDITKIDKQLFVPLKSCTTFDDVASKRSGPMRGTVTMVTGESGAGKTAICTNLGRYIKLNNPKLKTGFISAEMDRNDWTEECIDNPDLCNLDTLFLLEYIDSANYLEVFKQALAMFDFAVIDSFEIIIDQLKELKGWSGKRAETELIKILRQAAFESNSCLYVIQQWTKGGTFVGSNKIKHMITAMMYVMFDEHGDRYLTFVKNRRCGHMVGKRLYFTKDKTTGQILFDETRFKNMMAVQKHTTDELDKLDDEGQSLTKILNDRATKIAQITDHIGGPTVTETKEVKEAVQA